MKARFKTYAVDTGLRNRVGFSFSEDIGRLAENFTLNHLKEHFEDIFNDSNGGEVDCLAKEGTRIIMRVQVWHADPVETTIPDRELKGFGQRGKTLEKAEKLILTNDLEQVQKVGGETARCSP